MPTGKNIFIVDVIGRVQKGDKFLMIQRSFDDSRMPGEWHLPGGKVDNEEMDNLLEESVIREIKEETNIDVEDVRYLHNCPGPVKTNQVLSICFVVQWKGGEPVLCDEVNDIKRFTLEEIDKIERNWLLEKMYQALIKYLNRGKTYY